MRIKGFSYFVQNYLEPVLLRDCSVVIDGQNLFYSMYKLSKLPFVLGPDCDRFASYIKKQLEMFKRANLKCHFLIKGGHENEDAHDVHYEQNTRLDGNKFRLDQDYNGSIINPLLIKDTFLQVLDEMKFEYTVTCTKSYDEECVALANKLKCPVISFNMKYCFLSAPYIPLEPGTQFDFDKNNFMKCEIYKREHFTGDFKITTEKLIFFILLTDAHIFKEDTFTYFFRAVKIPLTLKKKYQYLLNWLHSKSEDRVIKEIFTHISKSDKSKFLEEQIALQKKILSNKNENSMAINYFIDKDKTEIQNLDPLWFEKGVCLHHINIQYINAYIFKTIKAFNLIEDFKSAKSILFTIDVIKYGYDLLRNFDGSEICVRVMNESEPLIVYLQSIQKPKYDADSSVFENGWDNIRSLKLFEHFLINLFQDFNFSPLESAPIDSRMLLITLVYFTRKKEMDVKAEVYSILLSYVLLSVVNEKVSTTNIKSVSDDKQPVLDSTTDKDLVIAEDCEVAYSIMKDFFNIQKYELCDMFDRKTLHPLVEFQCCLQELNHLNTLCGSPYDSTIYAKTYNASFVYKTLYAMKSQENEDYLSFITEKLNPAATVLAFFNGLVQTYEKILYNEY